MVSFSWAAAGVLLKQLVGEEDLVFRKEEQGEEGISGGLQGRESDQLTRPGQAAPKSGTGQGADQLPGPWEGRLR